VKDPNLDLNTSKPAIVSVEMGYGHLRAAFPLVDRFDSPLIRADEPPIAAFDEQQLWRWVRNAHEGLSRLSQLPGRMGELMRASMDSVTMIDPLHAGSELSRPNLGVLALDTLIKRGLGRGLVEKLRQNDQSLIATYYATAIIADRARLKRVFCVATDADIHRVWAPVKAEETTVFYFAPSTRVVHRLRAYGVPKDRIDLTGFPLPVELLGDRNLTAARKNAAARLVRLDPENLLQRMFRCEIDRLLGPLPEVERGRPPLLTFAVGGAGAQANIAVQFLVSLRDLIVQNCGFVLKSNSTSPASRRCSTTGCKSSSIRILKRTIVASTHCSPRPTFCGPNPVNSAFMQRSVFRLFSVNRSARTNDIIDVGYLNTAQRLSREIQKRRKSGY